MYFHDALHTSAYRLLNLLILSDGLSWSDYSETSGTAVSVKIPSNISLPSSDMKSFEISDLLARWKGFRRFTSNHHFGALLDLSLVSFLAFTNHREAAYTMGLDILGSLGEERLQLFRKLVGSKVLKQYQAIGLL